jgi:predicted dienelactone hydrolase
MNNNNLLSFSKFIISYSQHCTARRSLVPTKKNLYQGMNFFSCRTPIIILFITFFTAPTLSAQDRDFLYGDMLPDAPKLAERGQHTVGVRTVDLVNPDQVDILNSKGDKNVTYDRPLTVEVWYPADMPVDADVSVTYEEVMGTRGDSLRPLTPFTFEGRAMRDAEPKTSEGAFPLVIVSHGYVGSRYLMTYLTENLASKGYVVAAIGHTESTFRDAAGFQSTLLNRAKDVRFVLDEMARLGKAGGDDPLSGMISAENTAIVGYSMGGYGVLNVAGAGYSDGLRKFFAGMTGGSTAISVLTSGNKKYQMQNDDRIKAVVAFAPWGMERGVWDAEGLKGLKTPTFFVAGSEDDISGYEKGTKAIYEGAVNADRYLLTYMNARHNVAPNPPPEEALAPGLHIDEYYRYAEPSWDQRRINNINQHFVTAFLGTHLKGKNYSKFLNIPENSNEKTWPGFKPRSSTGMELLHAGGEGEK